MSRAVADSAYSECFIGFWIMDFSQVQPQALQLVAEIKTEEPAGF
jgi:hypothetical protein